MRKIINWINGIENIFILITLHIVFVYGGSYLPLTALTRLIEQKYPFGVIVIIGYSIVGLINLYIAINLYYNKKYNKKITIIEDCMGSFLFGNGVTALALIVVIGIYSIVK